MELEEAKERASGIWMDDEEHRYNEETERRILEALPHYIFTIGDAKHRYGYCTACNTWMDCRQEDLRPGWADSDPYVEDDGSGFEPAISANVYRAMHKGERWTENEKRVTGKSNHLDLGYCPNCGALIQFRAFCRGRKRMFDELFLIRYAKDRLEPENSLVCVGYHVFVPWGKLDESEQLPQVPLRVWVRELCVIRHGHGGERWTPQTSWEQESNRIVSWLKHRKECKSGYMPGAGMFGGGTRTVLDEQSLYEAAEGTPFERLLKLPEVETCRGWDYYDKITVLSRLSKYPCIEYLSKLGLDNLARAALDKDDGNQYLNLRGKTAQSVLRISGEQWATVKGKKLRVTPAGLRLMQFTKKNPSLRLSTELCCQMGKRGQFETKSIFEIMRGFKELPLAKVLKYCQKRDVHVSNYKDYLEQMRQLEMPMSDTAMVYPKDFDEMHNRLSQRLAAVQQFKTDSTIGARLDKLSEYCFAAYGLVMRPLVSAAEVIQEGTMLHHCVGGYVDTYAKGNDVLCCLRAEDAPNIPLYTVEFGKDGRRIQCRGDHNRTRPQDVERLERFWALYDGMRGEMCKKLKRIEKGKKERKATA